MYSRPWLSFPSLVVLLLSLFAACRGGPADYLIYENEAGGYAISYPANWQVDYSEDGTKCLIASSSRRASVMIDVAKAMSARDAAHFWIMSLAEGTLDKEVTKLEDKAMQGAWDWYLSYDYETEYGGTFHGEAYFKQGKTHLYKLDTAAPKEAYAQQPFSAIIASFKLLQ
jgi:hypothetical protein